MRKCAEKALVPKGVLSEFKGEKKEEILNGRRNSMNHNRADRKSMELLRNSRMCGWSRWGKGGGRWRVTRERARRLSRDQTLETICWVRVQTL